VDASKSQDCNFDKPKDENKNDDDEKGLQIKYH